MDEFEQRYERFLTHLQGPELDGFLTSHGPNLTYLFNFRGTYGWAFTLSGQTLLLVDSRYLEQAQQSARNCSLLLVQGSLAEALAQQLSGRSRLRIGFEADQLTHRQFLELDEQTEVDWIPIQDLVRLQRAVKSDSELALLATALEKGQQALGEVLAHLTPGKSEQEVAAELDYRMRLLGGEAAAFETIVAAGPHSAEPHARPGQRLLQAHEQVLVDFGMRLEGYHGDLTRVLFPRRKGPPEIADIVQEAQEAAFEQVRPGADSRQVDAAARDLIAGAGYGDFFGHGTGHGLGLEIHELPRISSHFSCALQEGMIFTLEPGIYLPGRYGVRLEDVVVVTSSGAEWLSDRRHLQPWG